MLNIGFRIEFSGRNTLPIANNPSTNAINQEKNTDTGIEISEGIADFRVHLKLNQTIKWQEFLRYKISHLTIYSLHLSSPENFFFLSIKSHLVLKKYCIPYIKRKILGIVIVFTYKKVSNFSFLRHLNVSQQLSR